MKNIHVLLYTHETADKQIKINEKSKKILHDPRKQQTCS